MSFDGCIFSFKHWVYVCVCVCALQRPFNSIVHFRCNLHLISGNKQVKLAKASKNAEVWLNGCTQMELRHTHARAFAYHIYWIFYCFYAIQLRGEREWASKKRAHETRVKEKHVKRLNPVEVVSHYRRRHHHCFCFCSCLRHSIRCRLCLYRNKTPSRSLALSYLFLSISHSSHYTTYHLN